MGIIDTIVVGIIVIGGLMIFYKALKEPIDMVGRAIRSGFEAIRDKFSGGGDGSGYEVIKYG